MENLQSQNQKIQQQKFKNFFGKSQSQPDSDKVILASGPEPNPKPDKINIQIYVKKENILVKLKILRKKYQKYPTIQNQSRFQPYGECSSKEAKTSNP